MPVTPPGQIGTIIWENGTSGTNGFLKWTPTGADGYNIYRSMFTPYSQFTFLDSTTSGTYSDNNVNNNSEYRYYVIGTSNVGGNSLPSMVTSGYVYLDRFGYEQNTYLTLQSQIVTAVPDIKNVYIGDREVLQNQLPCCAIIPTKREPDYKVTTGQYDVTYYMTFRIYYAAVNQNLAMPIEDLMNLVGKLENFMESIQDNQPYWFHSDFDSITYDRIDTSKQLKYAELKFHAVRRLAKMI